MREPGELLRRISDRIRLVVARFPEVHLPVSDRKRLLLAVVLALLIHGIIFLMVPGPAERDFQPFDAPLYVRFDPLPDQPEPVAEPESVPELEPELEPAPHESTPPEPEPEAEPEPVTPDLIGGETDPVTAAIPERAPDPAPVPAPSPSPRITPQPPADSAPPAAGLQPAPEAPSESAPAPVPSSPDPAPPAREAPTRTVQRGDLRSAPSAVDDRRLATDLERFYDWQKQFSEELADYQRQQDAVRSDAIESTPREQEISGTETFIADQLNRILDAIRTADRNVITLRDDNGPESPGSDHDTATADDRGDGSGIEIDTPGGTRRRVTGSGLDLREVSLPAGFPAEYPVRVVFRVNAQGEVFSARPTPPTPSVELNSSISTAVEQWRFEPAPGSSPVEGSVTIIVDTATRR